jgi:hypothetical protein
MLAILRRVLEVRAEQRAAELADVRVSYTISPWRRLAQITGQKYAGGIGIVLGMSTSLVMHLSVLLAVGLVPLAVVDLSNDAPLVMNVIEEPLPEAFNEPELQMARPDEQEADSVWESLATSAAPQPSHQEKLDSIERNPEFVLMAEVPHQENSLEGLDLSQLVVTKGLVGQEIAHVDGAVDRLTWEIATNLETNDLIVVWLMDASVSLVGERQQVSQRLERVYREINELGKVRGDALVSAVVSFGKEFEPIVEPTADGEKIVEGIKSFLVDESGIENVFSAVGYTIDRYKPYITHQRRKMMVIVWTDESGDDYAHVDGAVAICQRLNVPVFIVGPSAMFGKEQGSRPYVHPQDGKTYQLPLNRGPDAICQERIHLPYWFEGGQLDNLHAGLGPFALTRLAYESGGAYFIKDDPGGKSPFDLQTMVNYVPEYLSVGDYLEAVRASRLRSAIMQAVEVTRRAKFKDTPQLEFAPTGDDYQQQLLDAQKTAAFNSQIIEDALAPFGARGLEAEYEREKSPRWRAWYDLTLGRLLAMQVRCNEYNWACSVLKGRGREFVDQKSNRWRFVPDPKLNFGSASERQAADAIRLLTRCVNNNPGTPWALLAQRELKDPLGFRVEETYVPPPPPPPPAPPRPVVNPPPPPPPQGRSSEQPRELPKPKPVVLPKL